MRGGQEVARRTTRQCLQSGPKPLREPEHTRAVPQVVCGELGASPLPRLRPADVSLDSGTLTLSWG